MTGSELLKLILQGSLETLYMTIVSTFLAYVIGIPLGVLLYVTDKKGICKCKTVNIIFGAIVNFIRSVPFIILLVLVIPFTRMVVGTTLGSTASIVPLVLSAAPFVARMIESSLKEVDQGVIEAAQAMGSSPMNIIFKVLLPEAKPSIIVGATITITTILGYSAMAGFVGGGGLGTIAINYGYYRYDTETMWVTLIAIVIIVQVFQFIGMKIASVVDKRIRH